MEKMVEIDGSFGEGGGQILRTSLCLSLLTGKPFHIKNIRANRRKPGLRRQHVTCARAAARIGSAKIQGARPGSSDLTFEPQTLQGGHFRLSVGTAGSTTMVLQSVLPALVVADGPSDITLEGGTHNPMAPPFDFIQRTYLPVLKSMGAGIEAEIERPGFYPKGGGRLRVKVTPVKELRRYDLQSRGEIESIKARAVISNLPRSIADRELGVCRRKLKLREFQTSIEDFSGKGPGNCVFIDVNCQRIHETFVGFGERGVKAEVVANNAVKAAKRYLEADYPVGEYLADQLLLPLAIAGGGSFRCGELSLHAQTNIDTIQKFLDVEIIVQPEANGNLIIIDS